MGNIFKTIAYHKSAQSAASESVRKQMYNICKRDDAWLGYGIYFWERKVDAEKWDGRYIDPVITSAQLSCDYNLFLNLDTADGISEFKEFVQFCQKEFSSSNYDIVFSRKNDYYVSTVFCQYYKMIYHTMLMKYSFLKCSSKPQYCASDNTIVSNIRLASINDCGKWKWL